jgi:hypothetical protein
MALTVYQRFFEKTRRNPSTSCLEWTASTVKGYGQISFQGKMYSAHRFAWEIAHGAIPKGAQVLHNCPHGDNPLCVEVAHLWLGTNADNMKDRDAKGRQPQGETAGSAKLTAAQVLEIRALYSRGGFTQKELGPLFGVGRSTINYAITGRNWKAVIKGSQGKTPS